MIRMSVLYPRTEGAAFDIEYYKDRHMALAADILGIDRGRIAVDVGIDGPYVAVGHLTFDDLPSMQAAFASERMSELAADTPKYTTITSVVQVSEVVN